jgi:hypothetical protein
MTNAIKTLLQMQNGFLQLESTLFDSVVCGHWYNEGHGILGRLLLSFQKVSM